jgi:hypothetical protein
VWPHLNPGRQAEKNGVCVEARVLVWDFGDGIEGSTGPEQWWVVGGDEVVAGG